MSLLQDLQANHLEARKSKDSETLSILQVALADIKNEQIKKGSDLEDAEVQTVLSRQVKQLKDSLTEFERAGREDLVQKTNHEISTLERYLPEQLSSQQVEELVNELITEMNPSGPQDMGKVMGAVMQKAKGQVDGKVVQEIVKQKLLSLS